VLALTILPKALRGDLDLLRRFEQLYERVGIPALIIQVLTGLWLAYRLLPVVPAWFALEHPYSPLISVKLGLLLITALFAVDARFRIIPKLGPHNVRSLAWHIIPVTLVSVAFVVAGVLFRGGALF